MFIVLLIIIFSLVTVIINYNSRNTNANTTNITDDTPLEQTVMPMTTLPFLSVAPIYVPTSVPTSVPIDIVFSLDIGDVVENSGVVLFYDVIISTSHDSEDEYSLTMTDPSEKYIFYSRSPIVTVTGNNTSSINIVGNAQNIVDSLLDLISYTFEHIRVFFQSVLLIFYLIQAIRFCSDDFI